MKAALGLIADPQYCEGIPDLQMEHGCRRYAQALPKTRAAVDALRGEKPSCVLQLGDIIDGANAPDRQNSGAEALSCMMAELARLECPCHHVVGNNERRNFTIEELQRGPLGLRCNECAGGAQCYEVALAPGWRLIVLDAYHVTALKSRRDDSHPSEKQAQAAKEMLQQNNLEEAFDWPVRLPSWDLQGRFLESNGGYGEPQLAWLQDRLKDSTRLGLRVIIAGHIPVHPLVANTPLALAWDFHKVLQLTADFPCVAAYLAGHDHQGGYTYDEACGVHHITVPGIIEVPPDETCYVIMECYITASHYVAKPLLKSTQAQKHCSRMRLCVLHKGISCVEMPVLTSISSCTTLTQHWP